EQVARAHAGRAIAASVERDREARGDQAQFIGQSGTLGTFWRSCSALCLGGGSVLEGRTVGKSDLSVRSNGAINLWCLHPAAGCEQAQRGQQCKEAAVLFHGAISWTAYFVRPCPGGAATHPGWARGHERP